MTGYSEIKDPSPESIAKFALFMGLKPVEPPAGYYDGPWFRHEYKTECFLFSPLTNANHDYLVVSFLRGRFVVIRRDKHHKTNSDRLWMAFVRELGSYPNFPEKFTYRLGDFIRAAVLAQESMISTIR